MHRGVTSWGQNVFHWTLGNGTRPSIYRNVIYNSTGKVEGWRWNLEAKINI